MGYVIRLVGLVSGEASEDDARYVCTIGEGFLSTTCLAAQALAFDTPQAAFEFWLARRLGAFHAVIEARDEARRRRDPSL